MKRILLFVLISFCFQISLHSQLTIPDPLRCFTVEYNQLRKSELRIPSTQEFEKTMSAQINAAKSDPAGNGILQGVLQIPVIVHVVHFGEAIGTGTNIAAAQVYSQIEVMNEDFRRKQGTLGYSSDSRSADTEIEFVLAEYDPQGNKLAEPGIRRYKGPLPAYVWDDIDLLIKPATIYDPARYLNMWTVNFAALLLGYAQFPDPAHGLASGLGCDPGSASTDGVVMGYNAFGSRAKYPQGTYHKNYDLGRTVTHEVGHYLGLRHIWGDGGCEVDDYCGDTPNADGESTGCPAGRISCGNITMYENYMDYSYDRCMNVFTKDQSLRMRTVLTKSPRRRELLSSTVHLSPVALDAAIIDIVSPSGEFCNGDQVPEILLRNLGQTTLTSVAIQYKINSGPAKTFQWTGSLTTGGIALVALPAISGKNGTNTLTVSASSPNGSSDGRNFNDAWTTTFTVSNNGEKANFSEGFESGSFPPGNKWIIQNPDRCVSWSPVTNITGSDGQLTSATFLDYYEYNAPGTQDALLLPLVNLNNVSARAMEFDVAYSPSDGYNDQLQVFVSEDCGASYFKVYDKSGAALATTGSQANAFYPTAAGQWRRESVDLTSFKSSQLLVKFVGVNDYGDNIFIDNIFVGGQSVSITNGAAPVPLLNSEEMPEVRLLPNPSNGNFDLIFHSSKEGNVQLRLVNAIGAIVQRSNHYAVEGENKIAVNAIGTASGMYYVLLSAPDGLIRKKVIIR